MSRETNYVREVGGVGVSLLRILGTPLFRGMGVLSKQTKLNQVMGQTSIFSTPFGRSILRGSVLTPKSFFVASLLRFRPGSRRLVRILTLLMGKGYDKLYIVVRRETRLFSGRVLTFYRRGRFPIVYVERSVSCTRILKIVGRYVLRRRAGILGRLGLSGVLTSEALPRRQVGVLFDVGPKVERCMRTICVQSRQQGVAREGGAKRIYSSFSVFVPTSGCSVYVLDTSSEGRLRRRGGMIYRRLLEDCRGHELKVNEPCTECEMRQALLRTKSTLSVTRTSSQERRICSPLSPRRLLLPVEKDQRVRRFCSRFYQRVTTGAARRNVRSVLLAAETCMRYGKSFGGATGGLGRRRGAVHCHVGHLEGCLSIRRRPLLFRRVVSLTIQVRSVLRVGGGGRM